MCHYHYMCIDVLCELNGFSELTISCSVSVVIIYTRYLESLFELKGSKYFIHHVKYDQAFGF